MEERFRKIYIKIIIAFVILLSIIIEYETLVDVFIKNYPIISAIVVILSALSCVGIEYYEEFWYFYARAEKTAKITNKVRRTIVNIFRSLYVVLFIISLITDEASIMQYASIPLNIAIYLTVKNALLFILF